MDEVCSWCRWSIWFSNSSVHDAPAEPGYRSGHGQPARPHQGAAPARLRLAALQSLFEAHARGVPDQTDHDQGDGEIAQPRPNQGKTSAQNPSAGRGKQLCRLQRTLVVGM